MAGADQQRLCVLRRPYPRTRRSTRRLGRACADPIRRVCRGLQGHTVSSRYTGEAYQAETLRPSAMVQSDTDGSISDSIWKELRAIWAK